MRKLMFFAVASMIFFACSNEDDPAPSVTNEEGAIVFELAAVNELSDGMTARSPIYSQEATQHVTRVNVYAFMYDGTNYVYKKTYSIDGWSDGTTFKRYAVADADKVAPGSYKFLAIGRDASDMFTLPTPTVSTTHIEDMVASITASGNESEIFAGMAIAEVLGQGSRVSIQMTRKVAGILGYFKNVPQTLNGSTVTTLRLTVNNSALKVNLTNGVGSNVTGNSFDIMNINVAGQTVNNGVYTGNDLSSNGVFKLPNSQLGGMFFMPISGVTLTLGLYDNTGTPIKTWTVKDSSDGSSVLNISANHFYSLGVKTQAGNTTGGTPDPGDDDSAIDLLTDQNIVISISPAWETIHNLIIQ